MHLLQKAFKENNMHVYSNLATGTAALDVYISTAKCKHPGFLTKAIKMVLIINKMISDAWIASALPCSSAVCTQ